MEETASEVVADGTGLLWVVAFVAVALAAHVLLGCLRQVDRETRPLVKAGLMLAAAASLGTGIWSAMLLGISGQGLAYPLGYRALGFAGAWLWAVLSALPPVLLLMRWHHPLAAGTAGLWVAACAMVTQVLLVMSLGLAPGFAWRHDALALAGPLAASGCIGGFWLGRLGAGRKGRWRRAWRWTAAAMVALAIVVGQTLVLAAVPMETQASAAYAREVPAPAACLAAGVSVPVLLILAFDLRMRRFPKDAADPAPAPRRRRRRSPRV